MTNAYVADVTTRDEKSFIFGYLGGIAGIGLIVGPGLGGFTASGSMGYLGTMITAIVISIITLLAIFFWLKESHPPENREDQKKQSLRKSLFIIQRIKEVKPKRIIKMIFVMKLFYSVMMACYIGTIALYLIDLFEFNEKELGLFMFIVGIFLAFNQAFLSQKFIKKFGEFNTLLIGIFFTVLGLFSITITTNLYLFIGAYFIMNLGLSLSFPTFSALTAIHANPEKQGEIMGISESINSLSMAIFPVFAAAIYGIIGHQIYYFISSLPFISLVFAFIYKGRLRNKKEVNVAS